MKKKIFAFLMLGVTAFQLTACSLSPECKEDGCHETEIYDDGYCKKHYFQNVEENLKQDVKGIFNN
ncbi:hypothetical protein [uncultured Ruminococcus sp.]|uniref:hypothetical protein n=1 Tax=uncultured Ruminococcus sp. TaxID=165186 RepID=UPI0025CCD23D|nr:hypothetical protein [uncultured Ruminococcus sp.]